MNEHSTGPARGGIGVPGPPGWAQNGFNAVRAASTMCNRRMSAGSPPDQETPSSAYARPPHSHDGHNQTDDHKRNADAHEADQTESYQ